jgi:hypothetical protein
LGENPKLDIEEIVKKILFDWNLDLMRPMPPSTAVSSGIDCQISRVDGEGIFSV